MNRYLDPSVNYINLRTRHMNGGHYVVASNMLVSICLSGYREWVAATSQAEADEIVRNRSFLIPAPTTLGLNILSPTAEDRVITGVPLQVTVQITDDVAQPLFYEVTMQADNGNGGLLLYDDGQHGDGGYRDGIYGNTWTPVNSGSTTLAFHVGSCTIAGDNHMTINVEELRFAVEVDHAVPLTGTTIVTPTFSPAVAATLVTSDVTAVQWQTTLDGGRTSVQHRFTLNALAMQPGELRQVAAGTVVSYTGLGGSGEIVLPPQYVAARHLIAVEPTTQVANLKGTAVYDVTLFNPAPMATDLTLGVAGLPIEWVDLVDSVNLPAHGSVTVPLILTIPPGTDLADYPFAVTVATPSNGQDQAGAMVVVADLLDVNLSPPNAIVNMGEVVTYTATITNHDSIAHNYNLNTAGLPGSTVLLPSSVSVAAHSVMTVPVQVTSQDSHGLHALNVTASTTAGINDNDTAALTIVGDRRVAAALNPSSNRGGPGTPISYTLTVTNSGTLSDTYDLTVQLPAGWGYYF